jgi:hypothetical protein
MVHEPGDEYDCEVCGASHTVQRGKGLEVQGSSEGLNPALYVRCPEAGFVSLSSPESTPGEDAGGDDWP